ncbi:flagellar hook-associated protein 2 [Lacrimispora xylanisolvens]|uniref:Flagellar hook-associated protein 2 n=1 Tax=Lacrimispora xylanisolvens TaxID=384636 RepID=A0A2S6HMH4_9FIRM|nr:flagellar filament capping protein FliD [Hungatella xylanolytica]PPK78694.1 flagellar hook-associated protein 2 [Hungatella xylanolytica]
MASALTSIKNSSASSLRGYGGLASGLDRDTLIEGMTASTKAKIAKQQKKKQTYLWTQEAYRSVSSKLVEFSKKYTSYTNQTTNLSSPSFWARSSVTTEGANSSYVSVSGSSSLSDSMSIMGVKQLATKASITSNGNVSDSKLATGDINFGPESVSTLEGQSLYFKYGTKTYSVSLSSGTASDGFTYDYSTAESAEKSIARALKNVSIGNGKTLADVIGVQTTGANASDPTTALAKVNFTSKDTAGNTIQITGGTSGALSALGISDIESISEENKTITADGFSSELNNRTQKLFDSKTFLERVSGKGVSFTYNGTTQTIEFDKTRESEYSNLSDLANYLQTELAKKFGSGRIAVTPEGDTLKFETKIPNTSTNGITKDNTNDSSSVLSISSADVGITGKNGALKVESGESNRLNLTSSLINSGLDSDFSGKTADTELKLIINNVPITGLTYGSSMSDIMSKINSSDAGVTISYLQNADKFSIVSKADGSAGKIEFGPDDDSSVLFHDYTTKDGQDAIVSVKYEGSNTPVELIRGNNTFNLDGLNITVNGTFGYSGDTLTTGTEPITFNAKTDADTIVSAVTSMIKDYNEIIELVNKEVSTKPNRSYEPLTDDQKEDMTDDQITKWEEKAKAGMLFNDSELRGLSDSMRFIFDSGSADKTALESFGISTSTDYGDNGKLVLDETKFRAALASNSSDLQKLFTRQADSTTGDKGGVMARLTEITEKYASTTGATKGILIERAGSVYAPTSILKNSLQTSMDSLDDVIERLNTQLKTETDRYIKQFTNLETLISQMNSQSSWLSSSFGS